MKVLIAEDSAPSARLLEFTLQKAGYQVTVARNGLEALAALGGATFDAIITDWMMPEMDGMELIRRVRATVQPAPVILLFTSIDAPEARDFALRSGADDYLVKQTEVRDVVDRLATCLARRDQPLPQRSPPAPAGVARAPRAAPPYAGVAVAASTGGPPALLELFEKLRPTDRAAFFVVLHGPGWVLEALARGLQERTPMPVRLAAEGLTVVPGEVYVAPGSRHTQVRGDRPKLQLVDSAPENYVRPAADPLLRSVAQVFGRRSVGVVLTGLGRDGAAGCEQIAAVGGKVLVQDPATAVAPFMPKSVLELCGGGVASPLAKLPLILSHELRSLAAS